MDVDVPLNSLPTAARTRWRVQGVLVGLLLGVILAGGPSLALSVLFDQPWLLWVGGGIALVTGALGVTWANRRHRRFGYALTDEAVRVRDGVVIHSDAVAPLFRVQHVDLSRGPLQLAFGLATLTIHTAAPAADVRLPDLQAADGERVRDEILAASRRAAEDLGVADLDAV